MSNGYLAAGKTRGKIAAPTTFAEGEVGSSGDQTPTTCINDVRLCRNRDELSFVEGNSANILKNKDFALPQVPLCDSRRLAVARTSTNASSLRLRHRRMSLVQGALFRWRASRQDHKSHPFPKKRKSRHIGRSPLQGSPLAIHYIFFLNKFRSMR